MNLSSCFTNFTNYFGSPNNVGTTSTDIYAKVSKIMQAQNTAVPQIDAQLAADKTKLSGLGQLQSALASFQGVAQALSGNDFGLTAISSAKDVLSAATSSRSVAGSYAIQVNQLAQGQVLRSKTLAAPDMLIGNGTVGKIHFEFGAVSGNTFSVSTSAPAGKTVDLPSGAHTLQGIASTINGANIGVVAKVVTSGAGYVLELASPTGAGGSMRIGVSSNPVLQDLLAYDPARVKNLSQAAVAQDAVLTINGVAVNSRSNTVSGAIPGTTLTIAATGSGRLEIAQGSAQLLQNVTSMVNAYNTLNAKLAALHQMELKTDGSALLHTQSQLARVIGGATGVSALARIGITAQKNGDLAIDAGKLQNTVAADSVAVTRLFTNGGMGVADRLASQVQGLIGPSGSLSSKTAAINREITALNAKRSALETALTTQANTLAKYYSQQGEQGISTGALYSSVNQYGGRASLFDFLK